MMGLTNKVTKTEYSGRHILCNELLVHGVERPRVNYIMPINQWFVTDTVKRLQSIDKLLLGMDSISQINICQVNFATSQ